jgi:hypothetical protein
MADTVSKFESLNDQEKADFKDALKTFMGYQEEIAELKESQKDQIVMASKKIESLTKKDIKKLFTYFRKNIEPSDLREDAKILEEVKNYMDK